MEPLNLRPHFLQRLQGAQRKVPNLRFRQCSGARNLAFNHKLRHDSKSLPSNDEQTGKGRLRWQETVLRRQLQPVAERAGIGKIGWHTFRHTYSTMLRSLGVDVKVQQELLRHADIQTTLNTYTQACLKPSAKEIAR